MKYLFAPMMIIIAGAIVSCGGGGGSEPNNANNDTTPPTLTQRSPAMDASGIAIATNASATFDESILLASVSETSFYLQHNGIDVPAIVDYDDTNLLATLTPTSPLALLTTYTATLSSDISDLSGNAAPVESWSFTTEDGTWGAVIPLEISNAGNADIVDIAMGSDGKAIAIWPQSNGIQSRIYTREFDPELGWSDAIIAIPAVGTGSASSPQIAIDASGNAIAVWTHNNGTGDFSIYSSVYLVDANNTWSEPQPVELDSEAADLPRVLFDNSGAATAVWMQRNASFNWRFYSSRFTFANGWETAVPISTNSKGARGLQLATDDADRFIALWQQTDSNDLNSIYSNRFTPDAGWLGAEDIDNSNQQQFSPSLAIDPQGNAITAWVGRDANGLGENVYSNRFTPSGGWGQAELIEQENNIASSPELAVDGNGRAIAVWAQELDSRTSIVSNHFDPDPNIGWGDATILETNTNFDSRNPKITIEDNGNATVVWQIVEPTNQNLINEVALLSKRYSTTTGWINESIIDSSDDIDGIFSQQLVTDDKGRGILIWSEQDGTTPFRTNLYTSRFE